MQAVTFTAGRKVAYGAMPDPAPGAGEVLVEVRASGICHTDYEVLKGNYGTGGFPLIPGHEYAGVVRETGAGVTGVAQGDRVVIDPNFECGDCKACLKGWAHLCENLGAYGITRHGGFAGISIVNSGNVHPVGDMDFSRAALAEPMGCVLNGVGAVHTDSMQNALIFGAGPMGLMMGMVLRQMGKAEIAFCDIQEHRLAMAAALGFQAVAGGTDEVDAWQHRADLVVEATGVAAVAAGLTRYMANGGKGLFFGVCPADARIDITPFEIFRRQLTLAGTHSLNHNIPEALAMLAAIGPDSDRLVSHRLPLEEIGKHLASAPPEKSLKVQWIA